MLCWYSVFFQDTFINPRYSGGLFQRRGSSTGHHLIFKVTFLKLQIKGGKAGGQTSKWAKTGDQRRNYFCSGFYCAFQFSSWAGFFLILTDSCFKHAPSICLKLKNLKCQHRPAASAVWNKLETFVRDFWICQNTDKVELSMSSTDADLSQFANFFPCKFAQRPGQWPVGWYQQKVGKPAAHYEL